MRGKLVWPLRLSLGQNMASGCTSLHFTNEQNNRPSDWPTPLPIRLIMTRYSHLGVDLSFVIYKTMKMIALNYILIRCISISLIALLGVNRIEIVQLMLLRNFQNACNGSVQQSVFEIPKKILYSFIKWSSSSSNNVISCWKQIPSKWHK